MERLLIRLLFSKLVLVVGQAEERQYQAFYMVGDVAVGLISLVASITC